MKFVRHARGAQTAHRVERTTANVSKLPRSKGLKDLAVQGGPADHDGPIPAFRGYLLVTIDVTRPDAC